jgi:hypothetical protein
MAYTGKIYIADHNGEKVGIGQDFTILPILGGYAGFLVTPDGNQQFTDAWETEDLCKSAIKGGVGTVVIDDL